MQFPVVSVALEQLQPFATYILKSSLIHQSLPYTNLVLTFLMQDPPIQTSCFGLKIANS